MVGVAGFEPTASWSRTKRATICATPRFDLKLSFIRSICRCAMSPLRFPQKHSRTARLERFALLLVFSPQSFACFVRRTRRISSPICATPRFDLKLSFIRSICRCAMSPLRFPQKHSRTARLERFALLLVFSPQSFACFVRRTRRISSPICATPRSI